MIRGGIVGGYYATLAGKQDGQATANPIVYYYGKDQTHRVGQNYTPSGQENDRTAEFKITADETYAGGKADLLTITNASDEGDIDLANGPNNTVLQFPAGRYHLLFQGYTEAQRQRAFRVELRKIQTGTDDLVIAHTPGLAGGISPARTTYEILWYDLVTDGSEKFYFGFPSSGNQKRSHFLRIEKVA